MQKLIATLMSDLEANGMGDVVIRQYNTLALDVKKVSCDYFDQQDRAKVFMDGGEYMAQYSWAQMF